MTRRWKSLFVISSLTIIIVSVLADGGDVKEKENNISAAINGTTTSSLDDKVASGKIPKAIFTEGGSISANTTRKSVKKELLDVPRNDSTSSSLISGKNTTVLLPVSPGVRPENQTTILLPKSSNSTKLEGSNSNRTTIPVDNVLTKNSTGSPVNVTTSTTTTTTTSSTITTTPKPKKPTLTVSVEDDSSLLDVPSNSHKNPPGTDSGRLGVEEPIAQLSQEKILELPVNHRDYIIPIVVLIFAIPMILGLATVVVRRFRDYWLTRHYRRMDYLVDGMYND